MSRVICSKMWTDVDIRIPSSRIANCCKSFQWENYTAQQIREMGPAFFNNRPELISDKKYMVDNNALPNNCGECKSQFPGGYYGGHNLWKNKTWQPDELDNFHLQDGTSSIEVMLGTTCNMSCMYCNKDVSSTWADILNVPRKQVDESWKDAALGELYKYISVLSLKKSISFNFTGGEPLLEWDIFEILDSIADSIKDSEYKHSVMITSNMNIKPRLLERFIKTVQTYPQFRWQLCLSVDEVGNSLIRDGVDWNLWETNVITVLQSNAFAGVHFIPTISNLSLPTHYKLLRYLKDKSILTKSYSDIGNNSVYEPLALSLTIAPAHFSKYLKKAIKVAYTERHKTFLQNSLHGIGTKRNEENLKKAKEWFDLQQKIKNVDYYAAYPHLKQILDINIE
jgi:hypothetical protein